MAQLEAGTYRAKAKKGDLGLTEGKQPQVGLLMEIMAGPLKGTRFTWYGQFTEKTEERTIESLRIAGWTGDDIADLSEFETREDLPEVDVKFEEDTYKGRTRIKAQWINRPFNLEMKNQLVGDERGAFAARMRAKLAAVDGRLASEGRAVTPAAKKPVQKEPEGPVDTSDVPF